MIIALDLDGTLISAKERQTLLLLAVCARYGYRLDEDLVWSMKQQGANNLHVLQKIGMDERLIQFVCAAWLRDIETPFWLSLDVLFADTFDVLHSLRSAGNELVLVTARSQEYLMRQQVNRLGIEEYFHSIYCVSPARSVLEKFQILCSAGACAFVGDTETDFYSAAMAGIRFYPVSTGQREAEFLKAAGTPNAYESLSKSAEKLLEDCQT
jgi:phosphoglycolate phosphatase-like HAD superfamily hydrolase